MNLIIVESPGKIKTIEKILGKKSYIITSCVGHIIDLPQKSLGIDKNYKPIYTILPGKKKIINNLINITKKVNNVYLATDNDREGEFIAYSLKKYLKLKKYARIIFNSITKDAIISAINNPLKINYNLVKAQQKRRIIDRLIGYKITPLLYKSEEIKKEYKKLSLSVGRVQTIILRYIYDKYNEKKHIMNKIKNLDYHNYNINANVTINNIDLIMSLYILNSDKITIFLYKNIDKNVFPDYLKNLIFKLFHSKFNIYDSVISYININPPNPFITTTLQQEAYDKFKYTPNHTMIIAQKLYEKGFITYMRTDSCELSNETILPIKNYIIDNYGHNYYFYRSYKNCNNINAQEAHEAIRPVNFNKNIDILSIDEKKLYNIIFNRTIASQMISAIKKKVDIKLVTDDKYILQGNYIKMIEPGFYVLYRLNKESNDIILDDNFKINSIYTNTNISEEYSIPSLYSQITIIKKLEKNGIGRPSTYAHMLQKILKNYVIIYTDEGIKISLINGYINNESKDVNISKEIKIIGNEKNKLKLTPVGLEIILFMLKKYPQYVDYEYTKKMEKYLNIYY